MINKLGKLINTISESVGSTGVIVFFSCYSMMQNYQLKWEQNNIKFKKLVRKEPKNNAELDTIMKQHKVLCSSN